MAATKTKQLPKSFEELIRTSETPVLVDFWAEWCAPCRIIAPVLQKVAKEFKGRLLVVKVNVDEKPDIAQRYGIRGVPTLILFHKGKVLWRVAGALPFEALKKQLEQHLPVA